MTTAPSTILHRLNPPWRIPASRTCRRSYTPSSPMFSLRDTSTICKPICTSESSTATVLDNACRRKVKMDRIWRLGRTPLKPSTDTAAVNTTAPDVNSWTPIPFTIKIVPIYTEAQESHSLWRTAVAWFTVYPRSYNDNKRKGSLRLSIIHCNSGALWNYFNDQN